MISTIVTRNLYYCLADRMGEIENRNGSPLGGESSPEPAGETITNSCLESDLKRGEAREGTLRA